MSDTCPQSSTFLLKRCFAGGYALEILRLQGLLHRDSGTGLG